MPHSHYIAAAAGDDIVSGLAACYAVTKVFTSEFCLRPLIEHDQAAVLAELTVWATDPSPDVRRLVSEGTRPRLPWAGRLRGLQRDPTPMLPQLDALATDESLYVRRSVANHLGDIAKDHLPLALARCEAYLRQSEGLSAERAKELRWVVRHALRHPANKRKDADAIALRKHAK